MKHDEKIIEKCRKIMRKERRYVKWTKYRIGCFILKMVAYKNRKKGDRFFIKLAKQINEGGYGDKELRNCVQFAQHDDAKEHLEDHTSWCWLVNFHLWGNSNALELSIGSLQAINSIGDPDLQAKLTELALKLKLTTEGVNDVINEHKLYPKVDLEMVATAIKYDSITHKIKANPFRNFKRWYNEDVKKDIFKGTFNEYININLSSWQILVSNVTKTPIFPVYKMEGANWQAESWKS